MMMSRNALMLSVLCIALAPMTPANGQTYYYPYSAYPQPAMPVNETLVVSESGVTVMTVTQYHAVYAELYQIMPL